MNSTDDNTNFDDDIFGIQPSPTEQEFKNNRVAVRYVRKDINATLTTLNFFNLPKQTQVKLIDISSKGAAIQCELKLAIKSKVIIQLIFRDRRMFKISATVVHCINKKNNEYGLQFINFNNKLGDYLLSSQNDLVFK